MGVAAEDGLAGRRVVAVDDPVVACCRVIKDVEIPVWLLKVRRVRSRFLWLKVCKRLLVLLHRLFLGSGDGLQRLSTDFINLIFRFLLYLYDLFTSLIFNSLYLSLVLLFELRVLLLVLVLLRLKHSYLLFVVFNLILMRPQNHNDLPFRILFDFTDLLVKHLNLSLHLLLKLDYLVFMFLHFCVFAALQLLNDLLLLLLHQSNVLFDLGDRAGRVFQHFMSCGGDAAREVPSRPQAVLPLNDLRVQGSVGAVDGLSRLAVSLLQRLF